MREGMQKTTHWEHFVASPNVEAAWQWGESRWVTDNHLNLSGALSSLSNGADDPCGICLPGLL